MNDHHRVTKDRQQRLRGILREAREIRNRLRHTYPANADKDSDMHRIVELLGPVGHDRTPSLAGAAKYLNAQGETLDVESLFMLQQFIPSDMGPGGLTISTAHFFSSLIQSRESQRVLNLTTDLGLVGARIAERDSAISVDVVGQNVDAVISQQLGIEGLKTYRGTLDNLQDQLSEEYDAIIGTGSIGTMAESRNYETNDGNVELKDEKQLLEIPKLAERLSPNGFIAFIVPPRFSFETKTKSIRANLEKFDLHLSGLLSLSVGSLWATNIQAGLAIMDRTPRKDLFVAEVPQGAEEQKTLIGRFSQRKNATSASQGRLIDPKRFRGLDALITNERYQKLGKDTGLRSVSFNEAVSKVYRPKRTPIFEHCKEDPNAVYLPEMANTKATTRQGELPPNLKSYFQLIVNPEVVLPEYLARWLNSTLGLALRQSSMIGSTIPRIIQSVISEQKLYISSIVDQSIIIQTDRQIQSMRNELNDLESRLWDKPQQVTEVEDALSVVNHRDIFSSWIESLPFPLASILRSYHVVDQTAKSRYERLLHFFEALTVFCATVHLSASKTNSEYWGETKSQIRDVFKQQGLSLNRSTFGAWQVIHSLFSARLRKMLNDDGATQVALKMYGTATRAPLELFSSVDLVNILQQANTLRNRWHGHGGDVTEKESEVRHQRLLDELVLLRKTIGLKLKEYQLVQPQESVVLDGPRFQSRVRVVMGSNPQFATSEIEILTAPVTGQLYLYHAGHEHALELLPLVQLINQPQPASYFYNRLDKLKSHLIAYHATGSSEISSDLSSLVDLVQEFNTGSLEI